MSASDGLRELQGERTRAAARISEVEAAWREATAQTAAVSARLTEAERAGASKSTIDKLERELVAARVNAQEPWAERLDGSRAAARDVERRIREHVASNLAELIDALEADGRGAADRVNAAASALSDAHAEWTAVAAQIGQTITTVARPAPSDVRRPLAEDAARAAAALLALGGEQGPTLDRSRPPWDVILGGQDETAAAFDEFEAVPA